VRGEATVFARELQQFNVLSAKLSMYEKHSWSCQPRAVQVHRVTDWWGQDVKWGNQPGVAWPATGRSQRSWCQWMAQSGSGS